MINLLPYSNRKELVAARTNTILLRYNIILVIAILFLFGAIVLVYAFLMNIQTTAEQTIAENQAREQTYAEVKSRAQTFQAQLSDAKSIFDSEISYSRALVNYATLFPEGTALTELKLTAASFTAPVDLSVKISGRTAAAALVSSFENSPYISNFKRNKISINNADPNYPYTMEVTFTLSKDIAQ